MSAPLNPRNKITANTAERPVARTAAPRITTLKLRGTKASTAAASSGRQKMRVSMGLGKSEIRSPKSERNPNKKGRNPKQISGSYFGFRHSGFFRISSFGLRHSCALLFQRQIQYQGHSQSEQKRVRLQIAVLQEAQRAANKLRRAVRAAHRG